jgi:acyl dehydratase
MHIGAAVGSKFRPAPDRVSSQNRSAGGSVTARYFEDFAIGQKFASGRTRIDAAGIKAFAARFDPEPFHLDEAAAARNPLLGGLTASGWHTASLTMRLLVDSEFKPVGGIVGLGVDEIRWPRSVRPGDELHLETVILEARLSQSRPENGVIKVRTTTFNQNNDPVQILISNVLVPRRPA